MGKVAAMLDYAAADLLAFNALPRATGARCFHEPLERCNREVGRRTDVVGIFPTTGLVRLARHAWRRTNHDAWPGATAT